MKILIITLEYPPNIGGISGYVSQYAGHFKPEEVVVLAPSVIKGADFDGASPWKVIRAKLFYSFVWPHWLRLFFIVRKIIKQEGITTMHVHHVLPVGYVAYFLNKFNILRSYTVFLHGTDIARATSQSRKLSWFKKICQQAEKIVVNSRFLERRVREYNDETPMVVVNPCPAPYFLEQANPEFIQKLRAHLALSGKKVLLTVGRMVDGKGFPLGIGLLPELLKQIPNIVWVMVGSGPKRDEIIAMVQKNNLQNAVRFLGELSPEQLPPLYQAADAFVLLTHPDGGVEEGWGTVFLEASASGIPVVAGMSGGVEEAVENSVTGYVVEAHHADQAVNKIVELLKDPSRAKAIGAAGKARVLNEFTWDKQLVKL